MIISLIAGVSFNGVIGNEGRIPWVSKEDMKFFKEKTTNHPVIMGRKTFDSLPEQFRPLKNRFNVIITRNKELYGLQGEGPDGPLYVGSLTEAIDYVDEMSNEIFIIGGAQIYKEALDIDVVDRMYLNVMNINAEGDSSFPYYDKEMWNTVMSEQVYKDFKSYTLHRKPRE